MCGCIVWKNAHTKLRPMFYIIIFEIGIKEQCACYFQAIVSVHGLIEIFLSKSY